MGRPEAVVRKQSGGSDISNGFDEALLEPPIDDSLHRGLKARQISMIALGGAVGTGLIIGSATALRRGGPLGAH
ncbi:hypothetical protein C0992_001242 [Termitomyces sp. T32_za158]|nr:hypothetical protein C0992_001242 [Termitomyces sp. T32_za158]